MNHEEDRQELEEELRLERIKRERDLELMRMEHQFRLEEEELNRKAKECYAQRETRKQLEHQRQEFEIARQDLINKLELAKLEAELAPNRPQYVALHDHATDLL